MSTLCDFCGYCEFKGVVVWGREPNEAEKKLNDTLKAESKDYWCDLHERYFTKSFPKRKYHCKPGEEEAAEYEAEHEDDSASLLTQQTRAEK
jgi:hypothetical protein